jgi:phage-related protein
MIVSSAASAIGSVASGAARAVRSGASAVGDAAGSAADAASDGAASTLSTVGDAVSSAADLAADAAGIVVEGARGAGEKIGQLAESASDTAVEGAALVRDRSLNLANDVAHRVGILIREQPLVFAAAGLAMGVAIAAALPRTKAEDEFMGDTSDAVKKTVAEVATAEFERGKETALRVVDEIEDVATEEGLTENGAAHAISELGDKLKNVVAGGGEAVARAVGELAGHADGNFTKPA